MGRGRTKRCIHETEKKRTLRSSLKYEIQYKMQAVLGIILPAKDRDRKSMRNAIQIKYDPARVTYKKLLDVFWRHIDPTDAGGQFIDRGPQFRSAIFYHNQEQARLTEDSKTGSKKSGRFREPIVIEITKVTKFYKAEDYHQDSYK